MEDGFEKFEITEDDLEHEFNHRPRRKITKEQQIYGIWADNDDSDNNDNKYQTFRRPRNYTAPIGFVAGGIQQAGKKLEKQPDKEENDYDDEKIDAGSSSEDETPPLRAGFGRVQTQSNVTEITADIAGFRTKQKTNQSLINQGIGNWEKHTKGIGGRLLFRMGYQPGKGLGKELQGTAIPVESNLRKGRGGIGAYGPEKPASIPKIQEHVKLKLTELEDEKELKGPSKWKKNDITAKKTRYYYKSVDDVIEAGKRPGGYRNSGISSELTKVKVIDMTGPEQRILSGYHALSGLKGPSGGMEHYEDVVHKKCQNFVLPELQHNLDLLVDICEQDIIRIDKNSTHNDHKISVLRIEEDGIKQQILEEDSIVNNLQDVLTIVDDLMDPLQNYSLGQIGNIFKGLLKNHYEEYCHYELYELAPSLISPLLTSALANWNPLNQPKQFLDIYNEWKNILLMEETIKQHRGILEGNKVGIQPYDNLIWHTWVPVLRTCISNWKPRDCDIMINLIEIWQPLIPIWIMNNVLHNMIITRLLKEVNEWNPLIDTMPIHLWIHPWIPLLDEQLQKQIYPIIQDKLGSALSNWHPSDKSAKLMLIPWQRALSKGSFSAFLVKYIEPKLQICMQNMVINPHQQLLDPWYWVMDWYGMLSITNITLILEKFFFPRWLQTLALWLNHSPNYNQVTDWYSGWKQMLTDELLLQPTVQDSFQKALEIMSRAVGLLQQPGAKESIAYLTSNDGPHVKSTIGTTTTTTDDMMDVVRVAAKIPQGFKDLVMKRCEERGIIFIPIPNKYYEAKQVYKIGSKSIQCYIDRNVIFYSENNSTWIPTSLNKLLDMSTC